MSLNILFTVLLCVLSARVAYTTDYVTAELTSGTVRGISLPSEKHNKFLGIPYASPPVGDGRWSPPSPMPGWSGIRNATKFSAGCIQTCNLPPHTCPEVIAEDCLYLNVFAPINSNSSKNNNNNNNNNNNASDEEVIEAARKMMGKGATSETVVRSMKKMKKMKTVVGGDEEGGGFPVMVFIPGGRFMQGSAMTLLYDGGEIVRENNVVVIVINYRLGSMGFLATRNKVLLSGEVESGEKGFGGNYGFMDQVAALEWVQANARAFGGDPSRVMVFGQSAGGTSTSIHLTSPKSKGLFHSAIIESNPFTLKVRSVEEAHAIGDRFSKDLGCKPFDRACLRSKSVNEILAAQKEAGKRVPILYPILLFYPWTPTVDNEWVVGQPVDLFSRGEFNHVPIALGTVHDEALLFIDQADGHPLPYDEFLALLVAIFHDKAPWVIEKYPVPESMKNDTRPIVSVIGTDYIFLCPARHVARSIASFGGNAYLYRFDHKASFNSKIWGPDYPYCAVNGKICHGSELPFLFDSIHFNGIPMTPDEQIMSKQLGNYWANHAANPNVSPAKGPNGGDSLPEWPKYEAVTNANFIINTPMSIQTGLRKEYCDLFDKIGYRY